ncbi:MAG: MBL fold metallo-hydrolase [Myxococcales bacterium]|nr:MBL fold metallo-hydrolase [Myxococcales bacterium]
MKLSRLYAVSLLPLFVACAGASPEPETSGSHAAEEPSPPTLEPAAEAEPAAALTLQVVTSPDAGGAVNSTLVLGETEVVVVDAQWTRSGANAVADAVERSGRKLTYVFITHAHPDHYFGATVLEQRFPDARVVATASTVELMQKTAAAKAKAQAGMLKDEFPGEPIMPEVIQGELTVDGQSLPLVEGMQGDTHSITGVKVPSANALIASDVVFSNAHAWTADSSHESRQRWIAQLEEIEALGFERIVPGHQAEGAPQTVAAVKQTAGYLERFDSEVAKATKSGPLIAAMQASYPELKALLFLQLGSQVQTGELKWQ